jgi:hypothetical protein
MSAASFPLPELGSDWAKVIEAVQRFGSAELRTQSGDAFELKTKPKNIAEMQLPDFEAHWKKLRELGLVPPPASENDRINRVIAGEL